MELVSILRLAWRQRIALAAGALLAIAVGLAVGRSATVTPDEWTASTRLLLDTSRSQVIDAAPREVDDLGWRSKVLATLALGDDVRMRVARAAGVPSDQLATVDPSLSIPLRPATLPRRAAEVAEAAAAAAPYRLTVVADGMLPMVSLTASAPRRDTAIRLVESAGDAVVALVPPRDERRNLPNVVVEPVGGVGVELSQSGGGALAALTPLLAALACFAIWCAGVLALAKSRSARWPGPAGAAAPRHGLAGHGPAA
jgi:hypothetical protein